MSKLSRVKFSMFVARNVLTVAFLPIFFLVIFVLLILFFVWIFVVVVISLSSCIFMLSSSRCIDSSMLSWMLASHLSPFLDTYSLCTSSLRYKALCIYGRFLLPGPFVGVLFCFILRIVPSILRGRQPRYLSLSWNFCYVVTFQIVFSFSWDILF